MIGYQSLSPKICEDRDYTLRVWKKSWPGPKGLTYLSQWEAANELGPAEQKGIVRIKFATAHAVRTRWAGEDARHVFHLL